MAYSPRHEVDHASMKTVFYPTPDLDTVVVRQVDQDGEETEDVIYVPLCDVEEWMRAMRLTIKKTTELRRRRKGIRSTRDYDQK
jgi:hypothetical protein